MQSRHLSVALALPMAAALPAVKSCRKPRSRPAAAATEAQAARGLSFAPRGDGFIGEAGTFNTCVFAIRGASGKWEIQVEPGSIAVRNESSGETLRFRGVGRA